MVTYNRFDVPIVVKLCNWYRNQRKMETRTPKSAIHRCYEQ